jgi:thiol-disulfide isomerase/thioredoxin
MVDASSPEPEVNRVVNGEGAKMRYVLACLLMTACWVLLLPEAWAQSNGSDGATPEKNNTAQGKARRVWDNEEIQNLKGGISVVGNPASKQPARDKAGNLKKLVATPPLPVLQPPGLRFKATTLDGDELTNDSLQGKTVLVQFWTTWCPQCRRDQSPVDSITRAFEDKGLVVLAVDVNESKNTVTKYLKQNPRSCQIVLAKDTDLAALYHKSGYPTYVLIDRNGRIAGTKKGVLGEDGLRNLLNRAGITSE